MYDNKKKKMEEAYPGNTPQLKMNKQNEHESDVEEYEIGKGEAT